MTKEPSDLAGRVGRLRAASGLSSRELSVLAGLSHSLLGQLERGDLADMKTENASRLAAVLGVSLDFLVRGEGREPTPRQVQAAVAAAKALRPKSPGEAA